MKKLISLLLVLVLCLSVLSSAMAFADCLPDTGTSTFSTSGSDKPNRAEETEWFYQITDDGLIQARLWSITYGYWKTDWITIGHV